MKLPETRGAKNKRYFFEDMKPGEYFVLDRSELSNSAQVSARRRGYRIAIRNIDGECRVYLLGKL
jgi:hypothetical protein